MFTLLRLLWVTWPVAVIAEQTATHWNDMDSRPHSRQQVLYDIVQDVSGAYIVIQKTVSAIQLQGFVKTVVAQALEEPNDVAQICFEFSAMRPDVLPGGVLYSITAGIAQHNTIEWRAPIKPNCRGIGCAHQSGSE